MFWFPLHVGKYVRVMFLDICYEAMLFIARRLHHILSYFDTKYEVINILNAAS